MVCYITGNVWGHSPERLTIFPGIFGTIHQIVEDILWNVLGHSPDCLRTFPGMFHEITRNVWRHSPGCLRTFPGTFHNIPGNVWGRCLECFRVFPRLFSSIPRNVWRYYPEYKYHHISRISHISFPVLVFLVLYKTVFIIHCSTSFSFLQF